LWLREDGPDGCARRLDFDDGTPSSTQKVNTVQPDRMVFNSLAELSTASVAVITGKVVVVGPGYILEGSQADEFAGIVVTPITFTVESVVAGDPKSLGNVVNFVQLGGSTPEVKTVNPDDTVVKVGDSLLLFLSSVNGADVVTAGGPGGRFTLRGQTVVDAAANEDAAAAELKSQTITSLAGLIAPNLAKNPLPELPVGPTSTVRPGPVGSKPAPPETTIPPTSPSSTVPSSIRPLPDGPLADVLKGVTLQINGDPTPKTIGPFRLPSGSKQEGSATTGESGLLLRYDLGRGTVIVVSLRIVDRSMPMTATILDVLEVRLSSNEELNGDCQLDKKFANYSVLGLIALGTAGDRPAQQAWQVNADSGQIAQVEAGRVTCYLHSEPQ
jgi:hypothetical protein